MRRFLELLVLIITPTILLAGGYPSSGDSTRRALMSMDSARRAEEQRLGALQKVIVEFNDEPMFLARREPHPPFKARSSDSYLARFSQFGADAAAITRTFRSATSDRVGIRHRYYKAFFGVSATVPGRILPALRRLAYVRGVYPDGEVHATIEPAIELIGAPAVWGTLGTQGDSVRVGIIDSGIDYLHPALGGGFGPGFKVAGGYDFVNNDKDPADDNGHGTHVAGIIAADADTVKGVAPHSILYAYKALNAAGSGAVSDIIASIERTVDPDQNGDDSDRLDIVNMSIGGPGGPDDPGSVAVDNAVRLGVTFCIAAGNTGHKIPVQGKENNYFYDGSETINSPGTAELAITVGASDLSDNLAFFSSRGPNTTSFSIKPDVLAPGVDINSTYPPAGFKVLSGTSMATPMVAGVAALIKGVHRSWTPAMIKSAIVNKARNIGLNAYLQGGGRVRAIQSVSAKTLVTPSALSYGLDDPAAAPWSLPETLRVYNTHSSSQSYAIDVGGIASGISLNVSPSSFSIPAQDSAMVIATLTVDNAFVAIADEDILRFTGRVILSGTADTAVVPWAFVRTSRLVITTSEPDPFFIGYTNTFGFISNMQRVNRTSPTRAVVYAPVKGAYEFFTVFRSPDVPPRIVINEGVPVVTDASEVFLDAAQAVNPLIFQGVDQDGASLATYRAPQHAVITSLPNFGDWNTTFSGASDTVLISGASASHSFKPVELQIDLMKTMTFHVVQFERFTGMTGARLAVNSPADFIQEHFKVKVPPGTMSAAQFTTIWSYTDFGGMGGFSGIGADLDTLSVNGDEYAFTGYFGKSPSLTEDVALKFYSSYSNVPALSLDYESPFIMPYGDSVVVTARELVDPAVPRFKSGGTLTFGGAPAHLLMVWNNNIIGTNTLFFRPIFEGMLREIRYRDIVAGTYSVFDKNGTELFTKPLAEPSPPLELTADTYKVVATSSNYWLRSIRGTQTLSSEFNLGAGLAANPQSITSFMLLDSNNQTTDTFVKNEPGTLRFSVNVLSDTNHVPLADSTKSWYRKHGTEPWIPLALTEIAKVAEREGRILQADIRAATGEDSVAIDLRVASKGINGFTVEQIVAPAFAVGKWDTLVTDVKTPSPQLPLRFALEQNYPNPFNPSTVINYEIPSRGRAVMKVYDVLGREMVTLVDQEQEAGSHTVSWNASSMPSGVYFYRLQMRSNIAAKKLLLLR